MLYWEQEEGLEFFVFLDFIKIISFQKAKKLIGDAWQQ